MFQVAVDVTGKLMIYIMIYVCVAMSVVSGSFATLMIKSTGNLSDQVTTACPPPTPQGTAIVPFDYEDPDVEEQRNFPLRI